MDKQYRILHEIDINRCVLKQQLKAMDKITEKMKKPNISFRKFIELNNQNGYHFVVIIRILDQNKALLEEAKTIIEEK